MSRAAAKTRKMLRNANADCQAHTYLFQHVLARMGIEASIVPLQRPTDPILGIQACIKIERPRCYVDIYPEGWKGKHLTGEFFIIDEDDERYAEYQECENQGLSNPFAVDAIANLPTAFDGAYNKLKDIYRDEIEKFLMEINTGDLAKALKGLRGQAQIRLFNNLSRKAANALKDVIEELNPMEEEEMKEARDIALDILADLDLDN